MSGVASRTPFVHDEWRVNCARPCRGPSMHGAVREILARELKLSYFFLSGLGK